MPLAGEWGKQTDLETSLAGVIADDRELAQYDSLQSLLRTAARLGGQAALLQLLDKGVTLAVPVIHHTL